MASGGRRDRVREPARDAALSRGGGRGEVDNLAAATDTNPLSGSFPSTARELCSFLADSLSASASRVFR